MSSDWDPKDLPKINPKIVQSLIHQKLDEIRAGELESSHDLPQTSLRKILQDEDLYKTFESLIAKTWMEIDMMTSNESGLNGGQLNRKKKMYLETLKRQRDFCKTQIKEYNFIPHTHNDDKQEGFVVKDHDSMENDKDNDNDDDDDDDTVSSLSDAKVSKSTASLHDDSKRKKKKKKKEKEKKKKDKKKRDKKKKKHRKSSKHSNTNSREVDSEIDDQDMEENHTSTKDNDSMGSPSISKHGKRVHKRGQNVKLLFEKEKAEILKQIPKEVSDDFLECGYSKWSKEYLPCIQLGPYDVPPGNIRDQWMDHFDDYIKHNKPIKRIVYWYGTSRDDLSTAFSFINHKDFCSYDEAGERGYNKISQALQKKIDQGKKLTAMERYKVDGFNEIQQESVLPKEKRLGWLQDFEEDFESYLDEVDELTNEELIESPKKKLDNRGKRKREDKGEKKSKKQKSRSLDDAIAAEVQAETNMFEFEESASDDDMKDDDFSMSDSDSYENFDEDDKKNESKRKFKSKEIDVDSPTKDEKKRGRPKKEKSVKDIAQENFDACEKLFLPLMKKLQECKHSNDAERYVKMIEKDVNILTPSFIKIHQIGILIKDIRAKFKNNEHLNQECKSVTAAMKKVYHDKLDSEPSDFKPKLKSDKKERPLEKIVKKDVSLTKVASEEKISTKSTPVAAGSLEIEQKKVVPVTEESILDVKIKVDSSKPVKLESKPARKSFSLADMFEQKETANNAVVSDNVASYSSSQQFERPPAPKWITNYQPTGPSYDTDPDRVYAMQFLLEATNCISGKNVDRYSIARALEDALFTKYDGDIDNYMQRLHDICAAIAGKKKIGSIAHKIADGDYQTPFEVINIPRKFLFQSFEGFWVP